MTTSFFGHAKTGKVISRLNSNVMGAQSALTGTFINVITKWD